MWPYLLAGLSGGLQGYNQKKMFNEEQRQKELQRQNAYNIAMLPYLNRQQKPVDMDEVTRMGKSIEVLDAASNEWRSPEIAEVYDIIRNPEAATSGKFRFRDPSRTAKDKFLSGKDNDTATKAWMAALASKKYQTSLWSSNPINMFSEEKPPEYDPGSDSYWEDVEREANKLYQGISRTKTGTPAPMIRPTGRPPLKLPGR